MLRAPTAGAFSELSRPRARKDPDSWRRDQRRVSARLAQVPAVSLFAVAAD